MSGRWVVTIVGHYPSYTSDENDEREGAVIWPRSECSEYIAKETGHDMFDRDVASSQITPLPSPSERKRIMPNRSFNDRIV